nr:immunoglobulin heavy chain junction region [Macaca mulatta]MOW76503.1 immunoglobulin heavy chain junction region [Macaca mulatta]MOW77194.1 immunoglobulin heavy chain junction region [Macaca mulatta]MOW77285.1 immunoglobulin heavy chain junction region [Macaca mulatta]MOW78928.1 immunoglobulin heavy chain junction region [Macaca mulatta]
CVTNSFFYDDGYYTHFDYW